MLRIAAHYVITNLLAAGDPLAEVQREAEIGLEFASKFGSDSSYDSSRHSSR